MKNIRMFTLCMLLIASVAAAAVGCGGRDTQYLRIHIRADSNAAEDQAVKLDVRDAVVRVLTPVLAGAKSFSEALETTRAHLDTVEATANAVLKAQGFSYRAHADLRREAFPTRTYGTVTLPNGVYDALILELGSGEGDNWWCVAYPPLCFGGADAEVRSFFWDLLRGCGGA